MSLLSSVYANNFASVKDAKKLFVDHYVNDYPHTLSSIRLTGIEIGEEDKRLQPGTAELLFTTKFNYEVDYSLLPPWNRVFHDKFPIIIEDNITNDYEFRLIHNPNSFWRCHQIIEPIYDTVKIGSETFTEYTRPTIEDEWVGGGTFPFSDLYGSWFPDFRLSGGHPSSGGRDGDNDENSIAIDIFYPGAVINQPIYRLPWEDTWENESALFSDAFAEYIALKNTIDGGGWSGSTTATLEFT
jgi:hypothetical protein